MFNAWIIFLMASYTWEDVFPDLAWVTDWQIEMQWRRPPLHKLILFFLFFVLFIFVLVNIFLSFSGNCDIALTGCLSCHCDIKRFSVYNHCMCYSSVESVILLSWCLLCHCDIKCYCRNASNLICCTGLRHGCTYPAKYINTYLWYAKKNFFSDI